MDLNAQAQRVFDALRGKPLLFARVLRLAREQCLYPWKEYHTGLYTRSSAAKREIARAFRNEDGEWEWETPENSGTCRKKKEAMKEADGALSKEGFLFGASGTWGPRED